MNPKTKEEWRRHFANRKETLSVLEQETQCLFLNRHFINSTLFHRAQHLALFHSVKPEPCLKFLIDAAQKAGKTLYLPRYDNPSETYHFAQWPPDAPLEMGPYNIPQPAANTALNPAFDLILIPGLAFDAQGNRLGHGAGIYDRLLVNEGGLRIGVAFDYQRVPKLPSEPHDCPMDYILTETGLISV